MIAIIDYGMGNIHSVKKALELFGAKTKVTNAAAEIKECDKLVLPGVGAFDDAIVELKKYGLIEVIKQQIGGKKPFLGICLGMQLLFENSLEAKKEKGLALLKGTVRKFTLGPEMKVPHMGWNQIRKGSRECPLLKDIPDNAYVYFCHSYYPQPQEGEIVAATTDYGISFTSVIAKDNCFGVQFHPEKSQAVGLQILENFVKL